MTVQPDKDGAILFAIAVILIVFCLIRACHAQVVYDDPRPPMPVPESDTLLANDTTWHWDVLGRKFHHTVK